MNPELLLTHFDRISEAPDAIMRLRQFVLDLAVRGKLIEQDPKDEPASEVLRRIQAEKARLVKEGKINPPKPATPASSDDLAFELRPKWEAVRISQILLELQTGPFGSSLHQSDYQKGGVPVINPASIQNEQLVPIERMAIGPTTLDRLATFKLCTGDIVMARRGEMGRCAVVTKKEDGWLCGTGSLILRLPSNVSARFLVMLIGSPFVREYLGGSAVGATMQNLNQSILLNLIVGLPPLVEQHRIVAKVDELMALCDRLEAVGKEREERRTTLTAASFHHLDSESDADLRRQHTRFVLGHLPQLTVRSDQINRLRQTVLNLAIRGQLVRQDPNDEPAQDLLIRIQAEKARLFREGLTKKLDSTALPTASDFPFALPLGWATSSLQSLCVSVTDGDHLPPPKADQGVPFLVIGNVRSQTLDFAGCRHVSEQYYEALDAIRRPQKGDILYTLVGSYGIPVIVRNNRPFCVQRHIGILRPVELVSIEFLSRVLESKWVFDQATACATGIAQKTVPLSGLRKILIPLPPVAEQNRIVAKVGELMNLCDRLETQLITAQSDRRSLLEAVLHHTLNGNTTAPQPSLTALLHG